MSTPINILNRGITVGYCHERAKPLLRCERGVCLLAIEVRHYHMCANCNGPLLVIADLWFSVFTGWFSMPSTSISYMGGWKTFCGTSSYSLKSRLGNRYRLFGCRGFHQFVITQCLYAQGWFFPNTYHNGIATADILANFWMLARLRGQPTDVTFE